MPKPSSSSSLREKLDQRDRFAPLQAQLLAAASAFRKEGHALDAFLAALVGDIERAMNEAVEIFPVAHHSPAAAVHLLRRLQGGKPPKVIFIELCEDLQQTLTGLGDCQLPVALQAFATDIKGFPEDWSPLMAVAPITEFSAEFQAMAYAMAHPETALVFVDRAVDFIYQWMPKEGEEETHDDEQEDEDRENLHRSALGIQMGDLEPTFEAFRDVLLQNARVRHFSEWWEQYVEAAVIGADYQTYREVLSLVGSLIRRLGQDQARTETDRKRERYMWTRIKTYLREHNIAPEDALFLCGAAHAASDVTCFGTKNDLIEDIPPRSETQWLYGLIPSSFASIEMQFSMPDGTISLAENSWKNTQQALSLQAYSIKDIAAAQKKATSASSTSSTKKAKKTATPAKNSDDAEDAILGALDPDAPPHLMAFLQRPPALLREDNEQLLRWCVDIVAMSRKEGYLASTADSIAIYQTAILLARMRNRHHPSPYDFQDAAITCLEKDRTPKRRNIQRLCEILLGGDRIGHVGYSSLPPLAQDVYDRLSPLPIQLKARTQQRALMDLRKDPALQACSDLLWRLHYLLGKNNDLVRPIMGERALGQKAIQESWEISISKYQAPLIQLAYEGIAVEQVLEQRLLKMAFSSQATTVKALAAVEDSLLFLSSARLTQRLGERANSLLIQELGAGDAEEIFERIRRLVHYYRSTPTGLPLWIRQFVAAGYAHFSTLLPEAFVDKGTQPSEIGGMLSFIFTLESLALSMGCERSQLLIAIKQAAGVVEDPEKLGILWAAEWVLGMRDIDDIRAFFDHILQNQLTLIAFPRYLDGFLLALNFTPLVGRLIAELLSKAFERLPDAILMPWLPSLIMTLRPHANTSMMGIFQEIAQLYPKDLNELEGWTPPWYRPRRKRQGAAKSAEATPSAAASPRPTLSPDEEEIAKLLYQHRQSTDALASLLAVEGGAWRDPEAAQDDASALATNAGATASDLDPEEASIAAMLQAHPQALSALLRIL